MKYPKNIQALIEHFSSLPTVGPKTAERFVFSLLKQTPEKLRNFGSALGTLKDNLQTCDHCLAISEANPCEICADSKRDLSSLCIISHLQDLINLENTKQYQGRYFLLGGLINAIEGQGPENLPIKKLIEKVNGLIKNKNQIEIILALSPTLEGETTALYLTRILKNPYIKISRLARGLPMGANLEYVDEMTLSNALKYRNPVN